MKRTSQRQQWGPEHLEYIRLHAAANAAELLAEELKRDCARIRERIENNPRLQSYLNLPQRAAAVRFLPGRARSAFHEVMQEESQSLGDYQDLALRIESQEAAMSGKREAADPVLACTLALRLMKNAKQSGLAYSDSVRWQEGRSLCIGGFVILACKGDLSPEAVQAAPEHWRSIPAQLAARLHMTPEAVQWLAGTEEGIPKNLTDARRTLMALRDHLQKHPGTPVGKREIQKIRAGSRRYKG